MNITLFLFVDILRDKPFNKGDIILIYTSNNRKKKNYNTYYVQYKFWFKLGGMVHKL